MSSTAAPTFTRDRLVHLWILMVSVSAAGDVIWTIALAWSAVQIASPAIAGAVVAAGTIPRAVVLLVGGVVADRHDARRIMIVANLARVVVLMVTAIWVVSAGVSLTVLFLAAILFGVTDAVYEPAGSTIGRQMVRPADMPAYAGASQTGTRLGTMAGSAIGGFLIAHVGIAGSASVDALSFVLVAAFLTLWLRPRYPLKRAEAEPVLKAIRRGFTHLRDAPVTRALVVSLLGLNLAVSPALGLGIPLRATEAAWGASAVGILQALVGLGAAAGALTMIRWQPKYAGRWAFACLVAQGLAIIGLGLGPVWIAGAASLVIGVTAGVASTLLSSIFVITVDGAYFGRMVAIQRLGDDVFMPAAMILFGVVTSVTSVTIALSAFGTTMAALMVWPLANHTIRRMSLRP